MAMLIPNAAQYFTDLNGNPLIAGKVFFYVPNTLTPKDTYQDATQNTLNSNPVILNAYGQASIYGTGLYRVILQDSTGVQIYDKLTAGSATSAMVTAGTDTQAPVTSDVLAASIANTRPFATDIEAIAGVRTDVVMSPATTKAAITTTQSEGGYIGDLAMLNSIGLTNVNALSGVGKLIGSSSASAAVTELTPGLGIAISGTSIVAAPSYDRRQCAVYGPAASSGAPNFWASSYVDLNLVWQNISSSSPLVTIAANSSTGRIASVTSVADLVIPASSTVFPYQDIAADGSVTYGYSTLAPNYVPGGSPSITFGQFTFVISEMRGYVGNGTTAIQTYRVYLGEIVTSGTAITSAICYAYQGRSRTQIAISGGLSISHNIGIKEVIAKLDVICTSAASGWAVGDIIPVLVDTGATWRAAIPALTSRNTAFAPGGVFSISTSGGSGATAGAGNFNFLLRCDRGF